MGTVSYLSLRLGPGHALEDLMVKRQLPFLNTCVYFSISPHNVTTVTLSL